MIRCHKPIVVRLVSAQRHSTAIDQEADLGGGLCKKRIATAGRGKSGSTRVLIAKQHEGFVFFLVGRQKSDPGSDFSEKQVAVAKVIAKGLQAATQGKLAALMADGTIKEICR
jgi:hypothetical protein